MRMRICVCVYIYAVEYCWQLVKTNMGRDTSLIVGQSMILKSANERKR